MKEDRKLAVNLFYQALAGILIVALMVNIFMYQATHPPKRRSRSKENESIQNLDQRDPRLIKHVKDRLLHSPSKLPYNLSSKGPVGMDEITSWVTKTFKNKKNGTFIEAGAYDGEGESQTLYLEKILGWTGLLIECYPGGVIPKLLSRHRRAWVVNACIAPPATSAMMNFSSSESRGVSGTLRKNANSSSAMNPAPMNATTFGVETIPLYTILAAAGFKEVDFFSFGIAGRELSVLEKFPFDLFTFKVIIIEVLFYDKEGLERLNGLLEKNGYSFVSDFPSKKYRAYVHENVKHLV